MFGLCNIGRAIIIRRGPGQEFWTEFDIGVQVAG